MGSNTPSGAYYASVQDFMAAVDFNETARNIAQVRTALAFATDAVVGALHREFFPLLETRKFDWPNESSAPSWSLWLNANELVSLTSMSAGGTNIPTANVLLEPQFSGPPYNRLDLNVGSSSAFRSGTSTWQQSILVTGVWGYAANTSPAGSLASGINASVTTLSVSDSSLIGVGNVILIDSEYFVVTGRSQVTTSQTVQTPLTASNANATVAVTTGSAYNIGETILVDAEQMLIVDIAGNNLVVRRAFNGTVLALHTGSTIFAPRSLTVVRGSLGTTAAVHSTSAPILLHVVPPAIAALTLAEAEWFFQGSASSWQTSSGDGTKSNNKPSLSILEDLRKNVCRVYGRFSRVRAV